MDFKSFFEKCKHESTVSDFESYLASCVFGKRITGASESEKVSVERYSQMRDQAFDMRDEQAARLLYSLAGVSEWREGEWEGAMR